MGGIVPAHLLRPAPDQPAPAPPRYLVCERPVAQAKPGTETPVYEPKVIGGYWDSRVALEHAQIVLQGYRLKKFTVELDQTASRPQWDVFKLSPTGNWIKHEVYIAEMNF